MAPRATCWRSARVASDTTEFLSFLQQSEGNVPSHVDSRLIADNYCIHQRGKGDHPYQPGKAEKEEEVDMPGWTLDQVRKAFMRPPDQHPCDECS